MSEEKKSRRSKLSSLYPADATLKLLVTENPKRAGSKSAQRFEGYLGATTVGDAVAAGVKYQDIAYDVSRKFVEVA
jgi:hypothetical protein